MKEEIYKICTKLNDGQIAVVEAQEQLLLLFSVSGRSEQLADHQCKFYVNADWTKLKCECGKEKLPRG
jgi:hypothetical protein